VNLDGDFYFDNRSLSALRYQAREGEEGKQESLKKVSEQFEAFFIKMMLKSMRDASSGEGLFDSQSTRFYEEMFDNQLSVTMAKRGSFGISGLISQQVSAEIETPSKTESLSLLPSTAMHVQAHNSVAARSPLRVEKPISSTPTAPAFSVNSPAEFVAAIRPYAERAAKKVGLDANVLIAQSALETGWGQKIPQHASGESSFNLFGIKADQRWQGERLVIKTTEFKEDRFVTEKAAFRAYHSVAESIDDYVQFIKQQPRYKTALLSANDAEQYLHELKKAGYATDPEYDHKIIRIMRGRFVTEGWLQAKIDDERDRGGLIK